jgi:hypothetical protein
LKNIKDSGCAALSIEDDVPDDDPKLIACMMALPQAVAVTSKNVHRYETIIQAKPG